MSSRRNFRPSPPATERAEVMTRHLMHPVFPHSNRIVVVVCAAAFGLALAATPSASRASALTYLAELCTMDSARLDEEVESMVAQLRWVRRFAGPGSQHRKHIEGHAGEIMDALEATQTRADCPEARKSQATNLWASLAAVRGGR